MKKLVFIMIAVFTFSFVNAQDMSFGIKAGVNYGANKTSDSDYNARFDPMMGINVGAFADFELSDKFSVQPELMYTQSGANQHDYTDPLYGELNSNVELRLNYLSIPVMAKYYAMDGLSLEAGPYLAFLMSAKQNGKVSKGDVSLKEYDNADVKEEYKSTDFGVGVGIGYKMENGLNIGLRYNLGLMDINDDDKKTGTINTETKTGEIGTKDFTMKNNIFQFSVGYSFM